MKLVGERWPSGMMSDCNVTGCEFESWWGKIIQIYNLKSDEQ